MLDLKLYGIGVVRIAERVVQRFDHTYLGFVLSGLEYFRLHGMEQTREPFFWIGFKGESASFGFTERRENWVIIFDSEELRPGGADQTAAIHGDEGWLNFPRIAPLAPELAPQWQERFFKLREAFMNPTPANRFQIQVGLLDIIALMLGHDDDRPGRTPADRLRRLISDPANDRRGLADLSAECGYSVGHLRELFNGEYGISPQAYRNRCQMRRAMDLIINSRLSLKEIAYGTGFRHLSHFSAMFSRTYGFTAREAVRRHRHGIRAEAAGPQSA